MRGNIRCGGTELAIESVTFWPGNARMHDDDLIEESLQEHGQYAPILVQESSMRVMKGNGTLHAAMALSWETVAATVLDVDDEQAAKIVTMDNATSDKARNDPDLLAGLLGGMANLRGSGYTPAEVDELRAQGQRNATRPIGDPDAGGAGLKEARLPLTPADYDELMMMLGRLRDVMGEQPQGAVVLRGLRMALAVVDGGHGHPDDCSCDWCRIARVAQLGR